MIIFVQGNSAGWLKCSRLSHMSIYIGSLAPYNTNITEPIGVTSHGPPASTLEPPQPIPEGEVSFLMSHS